MHRHAGGVIDLLSHKGKFSTEQALVLAEAIDMAIGNSQLVTVPVMDVRFEAMSSRFSHVDAQFAKVDARFAALDARFAAVDARFVALEAKIDEKFGRFTMRMIAAMLLSQTALGPVGMAALEAAHRALSTFLH